MFFVNCLESMCKKKNRLKPEVSSSKEKFIDKNAAHLSKEELVQTAAAMQALQMASTLDDKDLIQTKIEELNKALEQTNKIEQILPEKKEAQGEINQKPEGKTS